MAYDDIKAEGFRQSVVIVDFALDINDPLIDFSGDPASYNTPSTTVDSLAYNGTFQHYIFSNQQLTHGVNSFPLLATISSTPAVLKIGSDVSLSASASVSFSDIVSNDVFELPPPYDDRRVSGSFWGKAFARNIFENRTVQVKRGYNPFSIDDLDFQIENYVVKSHTGLTRNGSVSFALTDRLFFATESKAKAPVATNSTLSIAITGGATSLSFSGSSFGDKAKDRTIINGDTGIILIGKEIISYTVTSFSGNSGTLSITRGQGGTIGESHSADDSIQGCLITLSGGSFGSENITDFNRRLFNDFTDIGSGFIDDAKWDAEKAGDLSSFNFTNIITKPIEVRKLLKETILSSGSWLYFDTILNEIIIGGSTRFEDPVLTLTEDTNILQNTISVTPQPEEQMTRQTIFFNKLDYSQSNDDSYYGNSFQIINGIQESDAKNGKQNEGKEIFSNWFTGSTTDILVASSVPQLNVERKSDIPNKFIFNLDAKDVGDLPNGKRLWFGSVVEIYSRLLLNPNGTQKASLAQIISVAPQNTDTFKITAITYSTTTPSNVDLHISSDQTDFVLTDLLTTTEAREYTVIIDNGVKIRSSDTANAAFSQGVFFTGATLRLINQGYIVGRGGDGGNGSDSDGYKTAGEDGGSALSFTTDTVIDNLTGLIGGGGGGGGGGGAACDSTSGEPIYGDLGGGGGGAIDSGAGGIGYSPADNGDAATFNNAGNGGNPNGDGGYGGNGGGLGENGGHGATGIGNLPFTEGKEGGVSGYAIEKNGFNVSIIAGNNTNQIKGQIV